MNVAVVAGEASGDKQAANLLKELGMQLPLGETIKSWGIGGPHLKETNCEIIADSRSWGTIGVVNSLSQPATLLLAMRKFKRLLHERKPDVLILVDFGAFNIPLAKWTKQHLDLPIFYYFPPSSWRRVISLQKLRRLTEVSDLIVTPFVWSEELLRQAGGNAYFLGHPLLDSVKPNLDGKSFDKLYGLDVNKTVITLLPGSREHEVKYILPVLLSAAGEIACRLPGVQFLVAKSNNLSRELIEDILRKTQADSTSASLLHLAQQAGNLIKHASYALTTPVNERVTNLATPEGILLKSAEPEKASRDWAEKRINRPSQTALLAIVENATLDAIGRADLVIATSGTATLEAAILGKAQIIVYRGSPLMNIEYKIRQKALNIKYIGLPNILADSLVCPELLQHDVTPSNVANLALEVLLQPERLLAVKAQMSDMVIENLGEPGATKRTASLLLDFLSKPNKVVADLPLKMNE